MIKLKDIALELLEYKAKDLLAKRPFSGGMASILELTNILKQRTLSSSQQLRFDRVNRSLERYAAGQEISYSPDDSHISTDQQGSTNNSAKDFAEATNPMIDNLGSMILTSDNKDKKIEAKNPQGEVVNSFTNISMSDFGIGKTSLGFNKKEAATPLPPLSKSEQEEQTSLRHLAQKVWWSDLRDNFRCLANAYRGEPSRRTVRLLYGLLRNLELYAKDSHFTQDVTGKFFKVIEAVPEYDHPFLPLNNVEGISELLLNVVEVMLTFKAKRSPYKDLAIKQKEILPYLRLMSLHIAKDPYAGKMGMIDRQGLSSRQIQIALDELERDQIGESAKYAEKNRLEEQLKEAIKFEDAQRELLKHDIAAYRIAAQDVFDIFASYLPKEIGGNASTPKLQGGVFLGENPTLSLDSPIKDARNLTIHLKGSTRFKLANLEFAVIAAGKERSFYADGLELPLDPCLKIKLRNKKVETFLGDNYLFVRIQDEFRALSELVAEGLAVQFILEPRHRDAIGNILEGITGIAVAASKEAAGQAVREVSNLFQQATKPKEALLQLLKSSAQIYIPTASERLIKGLTKYLYNYMNSLNKQIFTLIEDYSINKDQVNVYGLGKKPLSLNFGGTYLSIRKRSFPGDTYQAMRLGNIDADLSQTLEESEELEGLVVTRHNASPKAFYDYIIYPLEKGRVILARSNTELATVYLPN